jgi:hypothetical protein
LSKINRRGQKENLSPWPTTCGRTVIFGSVVCDV